MSDPLNPDILAIFQKRHWCWLWFYLFRTTSFLAAFPLMSVFCVFFLLDKVVVGKWGSGSLNWNVWCHRSDTVLNFSCTLFIGTALQSIRMERSKRGPEWLKLTSVVAFLDSWVERLGKTKISVYFSDYFIQSWKGTVKVLPNKTQRGPKYTFFKTELISWPYYWRYS